MKNLLTIAIVFLLVINIKQIGKSQSLGDIVGSVKTIDANKNEAIVFKSFKGFRFEDFRPIEGKIDSTDFYELGYDPQGKIAEINHWLWFGKPSIHRMLVYYFDGYRILLIKATSRDKKMNCFAPAILVLFTASKNRTKNFMINLVPMFDEHGLKMISCLDEFPVAGTENISAIMKLDNELFPTTLLRFHAGRLLSRSDFKYGPDKFVYEEQLQLCLTEGNECKYQITDSTNLEDLNPKAFDLFATVHPSILESMKLAPLWLYFGYHQYK